MESDSESDGEERGGNMVGFLFGNVDKDMQLEEDYMDEDARESLFALGDETLGGDVLTLQGDSSKNGKEKTRDGYQAKDADAKNYSDEEELAEDASAPAQPPPQPLPRLQLPLAAQLPPAAIVAEDDYDADEDAVSAPAAAPASRFPPPSLQPRPAPASVIPPPSSVTPPPSTIIPAAAVTAGSVFPQLSSVVPGAAAAAAPAGAGFGTLPLLGLAPPSLPQLQAGAHIQAQTTAADLRRLLSLPDDDVALPSASTNVPAQTGSALTVQLERAKAVGVDLPVLADLGSEAVLRFSELFGGESAPQARRRPARKPRQERQPCEAAIDKEVAALDDEAALLFAEEADEHEADVWASDDEAGPSDQEAEEAEEEGTAQDADKAQQQQRGDPLPEDEVGGQRGPPGRRRPKKTQGLDPLLPERDARSGYTDGGDAVAALPDAYFEPVCQLDWERSVLWEPSAEGSLDSAHAHMTQLSLQEEESEAEEAEVLSAGSPTHQPTPSDNNGTAPMLVDNPTHQMFQASPLSASQASETASAALANGSAALPGLASMPEQRSAPEQAPTPNQAPTPEQVSASKQASVPKLAQVRKEAAAPKQAPTPPEERWYGVDPNKPVEPLSAADALSQGHKPQAHHQMLRLEATLAAAPAVPNPAAAGEAPAVASQAEPAARLAQLATTWARQATIPNLRLQADDWLQAVSWDADVARQIKQPLLLDVNDPNLTFELRRGADPGTFANAAATILTARPRVVPVVAAVVGSGEGARLIARYNVSKDAAYSARARKKGERVQAQLCKHATPAASLLTLPIRHPTRHDTMHRPVSTFVPAPAPVQFKIKVSGPVESAQVKLSSLVGKEGLVQTFKQISLADVSAADIWAQAKAGKFADAADLQPVFWLRAQTPRVLPADVSLRQAGVPANVSVDLAVTFPQLRPLPRANRVPDPSSGVPTRPPGAFARKKDLTAEEGHIVLLEYLEEKPVLLSRPGMGVRLTTYYRKRSATDNADLQKLMKDKERWRTGHVEVLAPDDDSPFLLGDIAPGDARLAVDTNMFRAAAFPYAARHTDFLLVRAPSGALSLRHVSGTLVIGQQEPNLVVPSPRSKEARDIEENRLVVHVCRELRRRQAKIDKGRGSGGGAAGAASITVEELRADFPATMMTDAVLHNRLRERCDCQPRTADEGGGEVWVLRPGGRIPVEGELRKVMTPDVWCAYESMRRGMLRLKDAGLAGHAQLAQVPPDCLQLMFEALPPSPEREAAFAALELAVHATPWGLSGNFVAAMREGRGRLALAGPGDPTGRGAGFSFLRDDRKAAADTGPVPKREVGQITGTNADLRRLSMAKSREILLSLGATEDEIKGLTRWQRIALVRELSGAAMMDGASALGSRYARAQRQSAVELLQQSQIRAQAIFAAQAQLLGGAKETEAAGDGSDSGDDAVPKQGAAGNKAKTKKGASVKSKAAAAAAAASAAPATEALRKMTEEAEEAKELADMRAAGLLSGKGAAGAAAAGKLEANPGARRIRRTIIVTNPADGLQTTREIIYTDRDKVALLNSMYGEDNGGFGTRRIRAGTGRKKAMLEGGGPLLFAGAKARKGGTRKSTIQCKACGQTGHNSKNKLCPLYSVTHAQAAPEEDFDEERTRSPGKRPSVTLRLSSSMLMSPASAATAADDSDADEATRVDGGRSKRQLSDASDEEAPPAKTQAVDSGGGGGGPRKMAPPKPSPEKPEPPPRRRPAPKKAAGEVSARKALCQRLLTPVLSAVKRRCGRLLDPFKRPVQKTLAPDYNDFVDETDEMDLEAIERKLRSAAYGSSKEFVADITRIVKNATAYNLQGHGRYGGPDIIGMAQQMRNAIREELDDIKEKVEHADALVALEDAGGAEGEGDANADGDEAANGEPTAPAAPATELWVQCTDCQKWRRLSQAVYDATVSANDEDPWYCHQNFARPGASCEQPADEESE